MMYDLAIGTGATVLFDTAVSSISTPDHTQKVHIELASGEQIQADFVIGADGVNSSGASVWSHRLLPMSHWT